MSSVAPDLPRPPTPRLRKASQANLLLLAVADRLTEHWNLQARSVGLSGMQMRVLVNLAQGETATMRSLAQRLSYDASNLTSLVDRLERAGLVHRRGDPRDRRATLLVLTEDGVRVRDEFWRSLNASGPLDTVTTEQLSTLNDALQGVIDGRSARR